MSVFSKNEQSVALVDIGSGSVGAAYVFFSKNEAPRVCYSARIPVQRRADTLLLSDLIGALERLLSQMIHEVAPILFNLTGSGRVDEVFVTVSSPWQESAVGKRTIERATPFVFSHRTQSEALSEGEKTITAGMVFEERAVITILLDGYRVTKPLGKHMRRVDLTVLTSVVSEKLVRAVSETLSSTFHKKDPLFGGFPRAAYEACLTLFPHEEDFLILEARGEATDVLLVKHRALAALTSFPQGIRDILKDAQKTQLPKSISLETDTVRVNKHDSSPELIWRESLIQTLKTLAAVEPLPQKLFLITDRSAETLLP